MAIVLFGFLLDSIKSSLKLLKKKHITHFNALLPNNQLALIKLLQQKTKLLQGIEISEERKKLKKKLWLPSRAGRRSKPALGKRDSCREAAWRIEKHEERYRDRKKRFINPLTTISKGIFGPNVDRSL